jgi:hypothetical protein
MSTQLIIYLCLQVSRLGLDCLHVFGEGLAGDVVVFKMAEDKCFLVRRGLCWYVGALCFGKVPLE